MDHRVYAAIKGEVKSEMLKQASALRAGARAGKVVDDVVASVVSGAKSTPGMASDAATKLKDKIVRHFTAADLKEKILDNTPRFAGVDKAVLKERIKRGLIAGGAVGGAGVGASMIMGHND